MGSSPETKRALFWLEFKSSSLSRANGRFLAKNEKRLENRLKRSLNVQMKYIIDGLKDLPEFNQKGIRHIETKSLSDNLKRLLGGLPKAKDMVDDMETYSGVVMLKAGTSTVRTFKLGDFGINFSLSNDSAVRYMRTLRDLNLSDKFGSITHTTKEEIISAVTDSVMKGDTYTQVAKRISKMGDEGVFSAARAQRIAVNEVAKAYGFGNAEPMKEYKQRTGREVWKSWATVGDDRVSEICTANEKEGWIKLEETFSSGDLTEPSHVNCRCTVVYKFDDGAGSGNQQEDDTQSANTHDTEKLQNHVELRDGTTVQLPTGYAYHATPESNLESIASEGLQPRVTRLDDSAKDPDARIYLGTNPSVTGTGVGMDSGNPVLRIPASALKDPAKDPHIPNNLSLYVNDGISPDDIQIQDDSGNWISLADWMKLP